MCFSIPGKPKAKKRAKRDLSGRWYNPSKKDMIIVERIIKEQIPYSFEMIGKGCPVEINITWYFEPTKSQKTKKFLEIIENDDYPFLKKADIDNLFKFYADIMSKIIYYDDNQISHNTSNKFYSLNPRTEIEVKW